MTLTVVAPLAVEAAAIRGPLRGPVVRSGRGPSRAACAGAQLTGPDRGPVAVVGTCGALADELTPGQLVVASRLVDPAGQLLGTCPAAGPLVAALRRRGFDVRHGPMVSARRLVDGTRRKRLAATGALAVDTESGWLATTLDGGPLVVLRAVVDTPDVGLVDAATVPRGIRALTVLRRAAPALDDWATAAGDRRVLLAEPRPLDGARRPTIDMQDRQDAVRSVARDADLMLVAGSVGSPTSRRLAEVARRQGCATHAVDDHAAVSPAWLAAAETVGVSAGDVASQRPVDELVAMLTALGSVTVESRTAAKSSFVSCRER